MALSVKHYANTLGGISMKLSSQLSKLTLMAALLVASTSAFAKLTYVDGRVADIDVKNKIISIVENDSGKKLTYRYTDSARVELSNLNTRKNPKYLRKGEEVTLKLEPVRKK
jgi:hypothetical protein